MGEAIIDVVPIMGTVGSRLSSPLPKTSQTDVEGLDYLNGSARALIGWAVLNGVCTGSCRQYTLCLQVVDMMPGATEELPTDVGG
ncbi:uncharacterized protein FPRN_04960 [Fusarium proliferatum]|nr:uncharacterized protein FPRN_04960 [Fusarium proliferatum]